jgi:hypothetical protein
VQQMPDDRAWDEAARLVFGSYRAESVTWALIALRGQLTPGHPVLVILEEHRAYLRGERGRLDEAELAPLLGWLIDRSGLAQ